MNKIRQVKCMAFEGQVADCSISIDRTSVICTLLEDLGTPCGSVRLLAGTRVFFRPVSVCPDGSIDLLSPLIIGAV